jgi:hypothetical protein
VCYHQLFTMKSLITLTLLLAVSVLLSCSTETPSSTPTKAPDDAAALVAIKEINRAQADFIRRTRRYAQNLDELIAQHLLSAAPAATETGYDFLMQPSPDAVSYTVTATPSAPEARHFFTDQTGVIRAESGKPATSTSPEI